MFCFFFLFISRLLLFPKHTYTYTHMYTYCILIWEFWIDYKKTSYNVKLKYFSSLSKKIKWNKRTLKRRGHPVTKINFCSVVWETAVGDQASSVWLFHELTTWSWTNHFILFSLDPIFLCKMSGWSQRSASIPILCRSTYFRVLGSTVFMEWPLT